MCEANVYIHRNGQEELLMEKVDLIIPGDENNIFMESIFGERKVVKAKIKEMQLVHHRILLEEITVTAVQKEEEIWLSLDTDHGHFHDGEEIKLILDKGYNMKRNNKPVFVNPQVFVAEQGNTRECPASSQGDHFTVNLGQEVDGLIQVYARESGNKDLYAKLLVEVGHHHHHSIEPIGLPLEIVPCKYQHARMGEHYEIQVLKNGQPWPGAEIKATYTGTSSPDYPHRLVSDAEGKARLFLTARGNYLFSVSDDMVISTFTLTKSF